MQNEIYLWGSGGGASEIRHLLDDLTRAGAGYAVKGIVGSGPRPEYRDLLDLPYLDAAQPGWAAAIDRQAAAVVTAGQPRLREIMWQEIETLGLARPVLIHPSAVIPPSTQLAAGCVVGPHVTLSAGVTLGENVYISFNASVGHHSCLGAHGVVSPGARIGGEVVCGARFFIGLGGVVVPRVVIGDDVAVSAGALVASSLREGNRVIQQKSRVLGGL